MPVLGRSTEPYAECTRERRLDHAGIRAGVPVGVAPPCPQRIQPRSADRRGAQRDQDSGDPGWQVIGDIIQSGCGPTESEIAGRAVADHGVQRVDASVGKHPGHSGYRSPDQRRHGGIGGVLGHRFAGRAHQSRRVKGGRIATAQRRQHGSRPVDMTGLKSIGHRVPGRSQGGAAQGRPGGRCGQQGECHPTAGMTARECACRGDTADQ